MKLLNTIKYRSLRLLAKIRRRKDLLIHFAVSMIPPAFAGMYGVIFSAGLGIGKEFGDSRAINNKWDWSDMAANILGIIAGALINHVIF